MTGAARHRFFLGGADLEMAEIRALLERYAPGRTDDKHLAWGAKLSDYRDELLASLGRAETPVPIELEDDLPADLFDRGRIVVVDHHGARAGADRATAVEQVFDLLCLPRESWSRWLQLVAANDRAHVAGLRAINASALEIAQVRAADRSAQGVTVADELEARRAIDAGARDGRVTVIETTSATSSAIADLMMPELGGPGYDRLLVVMPDKLAAFGDGEAISALSARFPKSWWGGNLPTAGYWGMAATPAEGDTLDDIVQGLR